MTAADHLEALERHGRAMATVRTFGERTMAQQVLVLLDQGDLAAPAMIEWRPGVPLELTDDGITWEVPDEMATAAPALPLLEPRPAAPASSLAIDTESGVIEGPIGAVASLCDAVRELAEVFGGRSVASADWPTMEAGRHFTVAARPGEPAVLGVGDQLFELPGGPR